VAFVVHEANSEKLLKKGHGEFLTVLTSVHPMCLVINTSHLMNIILWDVSPGNSARAEHGMWAAVSARGQEG
jgi:hypothetical protein